LYETRGQYTVSKDPKRMASPATGLQDLNGAMAEIRIRPWRFCSAIRTTVGLIETRR